MNTAKTPTSQTTIISLKPATASSNPVADTIATPANLSDAQLFSLCRQFGAQALEARRKFIGLLPEVDRRKLYFKHHFTSIFHFAAVLAGVSEEQVRTVINRERQFADAPAMRELLVTGKISLSKINAVASMVTPENDAEIAVRAMDYSRSMLETWVRDVKAEAKSCHGEAQNLPGDVDPKQSARTVKEPNLSLEIKKKLLELEEKGININEIIAEALQRREDEIAQEKEELSQKAQAKLIEQIVEEKIITPVIPVATKRLLKKEFGTKCAKTFCQNLAEEIHHTNRFSMSQSHDPYYLAPLCKAHHRLAHAVDVKNMEMRKNACAL